MKEGVQLTLEQRGLEQHCSTYMWIFFFFSSKYSMTGSAVGCICGCGTMDMEEGGPTMGLEHPQVLVSAAVL